MDFLKKLRESPFSSVEQYIYTRFGTRGNMDACCKSCKIADSNIKIESRRTEHDRLTLVLMNFRRFNWMFLSKYVALPNLLELLEASQVLLTLVWAST